MLPRSPCPSTDALGAFVEGRLDAAGVASLRQHLTGCSDCLELVSALSASGGASSADRPAARSLGGDDERLVPGAARSHIAEYRLLRSLGRGAMGQVYLAQDERLDRTVAIKVMLHGDRQAQERFEVEARAIARLAHPNVVAVHRVGEEDGQPYLVSEFVRGRGLETLATPLPWREALRIGVALARGLEAAHLGGVLHRDIKPANAILADDGTAKLLDFGLAKLAARVELPAVAQGDRAALASTARPKDEGEDDARAASAAPLTQTGALIGTPTYMPPEAWRGEPATERGDVYSLGVVLYELCCGRVPHRYGSMALLRQAVQELDALPLREVAPGVDARLARVVERCLQRDPGARYASGAELRQALELITERPGRGREGRLALVLVAAVLVGGSGVALPRLSSRGAREAVVHDASRPRRALAILPFVNERGDPQGAWLSTALTELLAAELGASESLRPLPGESVARALRELRVLPAGRGQDRQALARLRRYLGADLVVVGTVTPAGAQALQVEARVQDAQTGAVLSQVSLRRDASQLFALVAALGRDLRHGLGAATPSPAELAAAAATRPANTAAARLFAEGLDHLRRFDAPTARARLEQATRADPAFALGHLALADAWDQLGGDDQAREAAARALSLASGVPREQRLLIEARFRQASNQGERAVEIYRALLTFFPESVDYGLKLSETLTLLGRSREALAVCAALHQLPTPLGEDPRIDLEQAAASLYLSDRAGMQAALERARSQGRARGAHLVLAQADKFESFAALYAGDFARSIAKAEEARAAFTRAGDLMGVANCESAIALARERQGDFDGAQRASEAALALQRRAGHVGAQMAELCNQALRLLRQERLEPARRAAEEALVIARRTHQQVTVISSLIVLGWRAALVGEGAEAAARLDEAERLAAEQNNQLLRAWALERQGELLRERANLAPRSRSGSGDLQGALQRHEEALRLREAAGLSGYAAESQVLLARLHLEAGRAGKALALARAARERFVTTGEPDNLAFAQAIEGLALSALGQPGPAREALTAAAARAAVTQNLLIRQAIAPAAARLSQLRGARADKKSGGAKKI